MAEIIKQAEESVIGEAIGYTLRHPVKTIGNTILAAYALHLGREWGVPMLNKAKQKVESWRQGDDEEQSNQQIEQ